MLEYIISVVVVILCLLGIALEVAATLSNNKEDPKRINYYRTTIYIILLFWSMLYE